MYDQSWKDQQVREESLLSKILSTAIGAACITAPILWGIVQYTN